MERLIRVKDIVGCKKTGVRGYLPISKSSWWAGVAEGKYPDQKDVKPWHSQRSQSNKPSLKTRPTN
jgi:hypothetical protein